MSSEPREYLIRKGGYYYRPNCSGYTTSKFEAGRYTKAEAEREAAVEPWHMSAIHQDDVEDDPVSSRIRMDTARLEALEAENAQLREDRNRYERQICAAEHGHTVNDVLANYRQIRRAIQDRRAREGGNADG